MKTKIEQLEKQVADLSKPKCTTCGKNKKIEKKKLICSKCGKLKEAEDCNWVTINGNKLCLKDGEEPIFIDDDGLKIKISVE